MGAVVLWGGGQQEGRWWVTAGEQGYGEPRWYTRIKTVQQRQKKGKENKSERESKVQDGARGEKQVELSEGAKVLL
jgi:hypothetical protein